MKNTHNDKSLTIARTRKNKENHSRPKSPKFLGLWLLLFSSTRQLLDDIATFYIFLGKLQQTRSRVTAKPMVDYSKGGDDFRCFTSSCMGRQTVGLNHTRSASTVSLGTAARFTPSHTVGPGPAAMASASSIGRQTLSRRSTAGTMSFGTSTRNGALKLYATYTAKK